MPYAAPRPCRHKGCRALVTVRDGYCDAHRKARHIADYHKRKARGIVNPLYCSAVWRRLRAKQLSDYPYCRQCAKAGRITAATIADHVNPIRNGGAELEQDNLQSLCKSCHNSKTFKENAAERVKA